MGGADKGLLDCAGRPLLEVVLRKIEPVVGTVLISANRNQAQYARYGYPVLTDNQSDYRGPLAGIERGLEACTTPYLWVVPCDAPGVEAQLLERLAQRCVAEQAAAAVANDGRFVQATFALLHVDTIERLRAFLADGNRKAQDWLAALPAARVDCSDHPEWFMNINTPAELEHCAATLGQAS